MHDIYFQTWTVLTYMTLHVYRQSSLGTEKFHDRCLLPFPCCLLLWYLEYAVFREVQGVQLCQLICSNCYGRAFQLYSPEKHPRDPGTVIGGGKMFKRANFFSPVKSFFRPHLLPLGLRGWQRSWIAEKRSWLVRSQISMLPTEFQKKNAALHNFLVFR